MLSDDDDAVSTEEGVWDLTMAVNARGVSWGEVRDSGAPAGGRRVHYQHRLVRRRAGRGHSTARVYRQ